LLGDKDMFFKHHKKNKFNAGEMVRVKQRDKIISSIDSKNNTLEGCLFSEQMWTYCGNKYNILKVVDNIFNEHRQKTFKTNSPLYILENLVCEGKENDYPHKCDHSCFLLWHEEWLEKE
jgi:CRISPR/Cas system endoribonuclease Cas6 (RAMP superfamily)